MLLRARIVVPVSKPPISDGFVRVEGNRITAVGPWAEAETKSEAEDLGEVLLLPGLVNAHCHLDYTDFVGAIPAPSSFTDWINAIVDLKADVDNNAHVRSWMNGVNQSLLNGITTVGNIETRLDLLLDLWKNGPLRMVSFIELIVMRSESDASKVVADAAEWIANHSPDSGHVGLSPHAPYTTKPNLLDACVATHLPLAIHLAESEEEEEMFRQGGGLLFDRLTGTGRDMADCGLGSPTAHVERHGVLREGTLAIHGNYLDDEDIRLLAKHRVSVVHCPRSHDYFGHAPFRAEALHAAGVNLCLGTDSLATVREVNAELSLFDELHAHREVFPNLEPEEFLRRVTTNPARALGMGGQVGELVPNAFADMVLLPYEGGAESAVDAAVSHTGPAQAVMLDGHWEVPPPSFVSLE
mgnify:CR=1 FL=1